MCSLSFVIISFPFRSCVHVWIHLPLGVLVFHLLLWYSVCIACCSWMLRRCLNQNHVLVFGSIFLSNFFWGGGGDYYICHLFFPSRSFLMSLSFWRQTMLLISPFFGFPSEVKLTPNSLHISIHSVIAVASFLSFYILYACLHIGCLRLSPS